jgi:hypothetical protein
MAQKLVGLSDKFSVVVDIPTTFVVSLIYFLHNILNIGSGTENQDHRVCVVILCFLRYDANTAGPAGLEFGLLVSEKITTSLILLVFDYLMKKPT